MKLASSLRSFALIDLFLFGCSVSTPISSPVTSLARPRNNNEAVSNTTTDTNFDGQFYAGATLGTLLRMEAIPNRTFYDFDGQTVKHPFDTLADAGVNAVRVEATRGQCLGPTHFVNNASTLGEELTFTLDSGCIDIQVETARRGVAKGMRVVLTINQGFDIPPELENLNYAQMVENVQNETKRQLNPFLEAKVLPDIILLENEGSDGFLFNETSTGHTRGVKDGKAPDATVDKELCGEIPTGNLVSYPQIAGYYKAEILAANEAIEAAGYSTATVRYGLHSHGQYVQWKESVIHGPSPPSESKLVDTTGAECPADGVIPDFILAQNASTLLTIAGFSAYPDPMTPNDIDSPASQADTLSRLNATLTQLQGYAESYGKFDSGPFAGQYKLQGLGVEYATSYTSAQIPEEQQETSRMWTLVKGFNAFLGMLWYEPWYCYADWEGGEATLCQKVADNGEAPTDNLKTWGQAAVSPWKD